MKKVNKIAVVVVKTPKKVISSRLGEELLEKWEKEVYGYWEKALRKGTISYPKASGGLDVYIIDNLKEWR